MDKKNVSSESSYMSFDDIYTACPNCSFMADRWDIQNGYCSACRYDDVIGDPMLAEDSFNSWEE